MARKSILMSICCLALFAGCKGTMQDVYYTTTDTLGMASKDTLVNSVLDARDTLKSAKDQYVVTMDRFASVPNFKDSELEGKYTQLKYELGQTQSAVRAFKPAVSNVENVGDSFFNKWSAELKNYNSDTLRSQSQQKWTQTHQKYLQLLNSLGKARDSMDTMLAHYDDQLLYVKHNLNSPTMSGMYNEAAALENKTKNMMTVVNTTLSDCDKFIGEIAKE